jgi:hypothetical protein
MLLKNISFLLLITIYCNIFASEMSAAEQAQYSVFAFVNATDQQVIMQALPEALELLKAGELLSFDGLVRRYSL